VPERTWELYHVPYLLLRVYHLGLSFYTTKIQSNSAIGHIILAAKGKTVATIVVAITMMVTAMVVAVVVVAVAVAVVIGEAVRPAP
jgi:hypothetical protein